MMPLKLELLVRGDKPPFDPSHRFVTSWLLPPAALFGVRALLALYGFVAICFNLAWRGTHAALYGADSDGQSFSYFTNLTYWGLSFYFAFAALHTGSYWLTGRPLLARWPRVLQTLHAIFYDTITVFPFIVTVVFWTLLNTGAFTTPFTSYYNISVHAMNSAFALLEILVPRTAPLPWRHVPALVVLLGLYLALAYITYETEHFYVYDFLDIGAHGSASVAGYCVGILAALLIVFAAVHFLIRARVLVTEKWWRCDGKFSRRGKSRQSSVDEEGYIEMETATQVHEAVKERLAAEAASGNR